MGRGGDGTQNWKRAAQIEEGISKSYLAWGREPSYPVRARRGADMLVERGWQPRLLGWAECPRPAVLALPHCSIGDGYLR